MSDTTGRHIQTQALPHDPQSMRFVLDAPVQAGRSASFDGPDRHAPLTQALLAIDGVTKVDVMDSTILVTCAAGYDWQSLAPRVSAAIQLVLKETGLPLGEAPEKARSDKDAVLLAAVKDILERQANPSIAKHGGKIHAESVENGSVYLRMSGGCQGCAASALTLRQGVETMLRAALPSIREIVDVTDHAQGKNPFYKDEPGQGPIFQRAVPGECIGWEDGQLAIDPDYLAPRLGLEPDALQAGLECGEIVITTEASPGAKTGVVRVSVRSATRAWAADVMPDGTALEIPPPRELSGAERAAAMLPHRVRAYLEALPTDKLPITYGRLARGLGMYAPGSIRKVTAALEVTMREDATANRPFLAARVVNRGSDERPGQGFFQLANALGRGPALTETDMEFHHRQLREGLVPTLKADKTTT